MPRKNIANDRLKNLRNSLVPHEEMSTNRSRLAQETKNMSNQNTAITSATFREKKRKNDDEEDRISKRYKIADSVIDNTMRSEFRNETGSYLKRATQQIRDEDYKVTKLEMPRLTAHTSRPFIQTPGLISGDTKKNNASERLTKLRNNIRSGTSCISHKNETESSPYGISHFKTNKRVNGTLSGECTRNSSIGIEQGSIESSAFVDNRSPLYDRNVSNSCTPPRTGKRSPLYSTFKSVSATQSSKSDTLSNVGKHCEYKQILERPIALSECSPKPPYGKYSTNDSVRTNVLSVLGSKSNLSPEQHRSNTTPISQRLSKYKDNGPCLSQEAASSIGDLENVTKGTVQQLTVPEPVSDDVHMEECDTVTNCSEDKAKHIDSPSLVSEDGCKKSEDICIIVDTNIFMAHLKIVKDIVNMPVSGSIKPLMYVPWMVLTELDFMKDGSIPGRSAQKAINYINSLLEAENCRIKCQTVFEVNEQVSIGKSPDDKIISCCLQISKQYKTVILLSNDVNARNKALIHGIGTCSFNEIMMKLHGLLQKNKKSQKILHKMTVVCTYAICECAKDAYGDVWTKMDLLKDRPWSLSDCLKIFKKYWVSVFGDKLLKQFQIAVTDLLTLLENKSSLADDTNEFKTFTAVCGAICFFLKDVESLRTMMERTIKEIKDINNS